MQIQKDHFISRFFFFVDDCIERNGFWSRMEKRKKYLCLKQGFSNKSELASWY